MTKATQSINSYIDHTLLKPEATSLQIEELCHQATEFRFASVCVNPCYVSLCNQLLNRTPVKVCTVVGFPLGALTTEGKVAEARLAVEHGAQELDMVLRVGLLKERKIEDLEADIRAVKVVAGDNLLKVILETSLLSDEEKVLACKASARAGADFVKTSTGFLGGGATAEDIRLMRSTVGPNMGVKASGGIRNLTQAEALIAAGANRLGTSQGVALVTEGSGGLGGD